MRIRQRKEMEVMEIEEMQCKLKQLADRMMVLVVTSTKLLSEAEERNRLDTVVEWSEGLRLIKEADRQLVEAMGKAVAAEVWCRQRLKGDGGSHE